MIRSIKIKNWYITGNMFFYFFSFMVLSMNSFNATLRSVIGVCFFFPVIIPAVGSLYLNCLKLNKSELFDKKIYWLDSADLLLKMGILTSIMVFHEHIQSHFIAAIIILTLLNTLDFVIGYFILQHTKIYDASLDEAYLEMQAVADNDSIPKTSWSQIVCGTIFLVSMENSDLSFKLICTIVLVIALIVCDRYEEKKFKHCKKKPLTIVLIWLLRIVAISLAWTGCHIIIPILFFSAGKSILLNDLNKDK
ncbi:MAG: hypothetical protein IKE52_01260 [Mogibacterium sp.]|nr:hypothetical protein [Mogibacterium sp.]